MLEVTDEYATQLTLHSKASLFKVSQRVRQKRFDPLPTPGKSKLRRAWRILLFLVHHTGKEDHERIRVFGDNEIVRYLKSSPSWLVDGTFKLSPIMFYQLYTVHFQGPRITPGCMYGFLPNKTESTYKRFLDIILSLFPIAVADKGLIDFELAAMKAFEKALPMLLQRDASSIYRRISSVSWRTRAQKTVPIEPRFVAGLETYTSFGRWKT